MFANLFAIAASLVGLWAFIKYIIMVEIRVDENTYKTLYDYFKNERQFVLTEEFSSESRYPLQYSALCLSKSVAWFYISHTERLLQAGWKSQDHVTIIVCSRINYKKLKNFLKNELKEATLQTHGVPVRLLMPYEIDRIGSLKQKMSQPIADPECWKDFDDEIAEVLEGKRTKTGALLYGPPGNGKTSFIKYLATKYHLPIMIFTLNPEWTNQDLLLLFAGIPPNCIVLMEDFDNYYDKRKCLMGGEDTKCIKFTFDVILNALDGVYNSYDKVVFIMTVNDIEKVDEALKNRPSRFKFVRHFDNPDVQTKCKLIPKDWAENTNDLNLDQIFRLKEYYELGFDLETSLRKLNKIVQ
jgi:hypothetical protein